MDINRVPNDKKLNLCQWYFRGKFRVDSENLIQMKINLIIFAAGFVFLPFVWVINVVWFFDEAFKKSPFDEQTSIRKCKIIINFHP